MERKIFNKITREIFLNYGFEKENKYYVLELKEITLFVWVNSWRKEKSFMYYVSINELHNKTEELEERIDIWNAIALKHNATPSGRLQQELRIAEWTEQEYIEILKGMLREYFDPYKERGLNHLKDIGEELTFREKAQMFLFSAMDVNVSMKDCMLRYYFEDSAYIALQGYVLSKMDNASIKVHITAGNAEVFVDENGDQDFIFYDNKEAFKSIKIGEEIKFFTTRWRFYNSMRPIISLVGQEVIRYPKSYPYLIEGKGKYLRWIDRTFPIQNG